MKKINPFKILNGFFYFKTDYNSYVLRKLYLLTLVKKTIFVQLDLLVKPSNLYICLRKF